MLTYNAPIDGQKSTIDAATNSDQMNNFHWLRKSIIETRKEQYFTQLASTIDMPKHMGKTIKVYSYVPLLDARNINDQGIDANGVSIVDGNLYGSSKDIGTITGKLPVLSENGGRVNRVGFVRMELEGSLHKFGFFYEFTKQSMDFDSDPQLKEHLARELMNGAVQLSEAMLQMDLLAAAGTVLYPGAATADDEMTAEPVVVGGTETVPASIITYDDLMRLDQILTDNRTPKQTKVIKGSLYTDTRVVPQGRVMYVGSEVTPLLRRLKDNFGERAFIEVQHYADGGSLMNGEVGSVGPFRIIEVPEMLNWAGAGAEVGTNPGYRSTTSNGDEFYDVFPMLVVGDDCFSTIGFQTDGKSGKFNVITKMPGADTADRNDPYGQTGFSSMQWFYGFLAKRPERIAVAKTVAPV